MRRVAIGLAAAAMACSAIAATNAGKKKRPAATAAATTEAVAFAAPIDVDLNQPIGRFKPVHRFFGCDEPNFAYLPTGRRVLGEIGRVSPSEPVYFRTHNLFTTGDGTPALKWGSTNVYTEDAAGNAVYDFAIIDRIFDAYRDAGVTPFVELGFMPKAMTTGPEPYQHAWEPTQPSNAIYTGWTYPPKDYARFGELCFQMARHCVDRYGKAAVDRWLWQTWNEANIPYWHGTPEEFFKLNDFAIAGVRRALPTARVGGPDTAGPGGDFMRAFLAHCLDGTNYATGGRGTPLDFVAFHAKGSLTIIEDRARLNLGRHLQFLDEGFQQFTGDPRLKRLPVIVGEFDPDKVGGQRGPTMRYRNDSLYAAYVVASLAHGIELADERGVDLQGLLTWAFEVEDGPLFDGFRALASGPIDHPVMNAFRLFAKLDGNRVRVTSAAGPTVDEFLAGAAHDRPDVGALAVRHLSHVDVLVWHYHDDYLPGPDADVTLTLHGVPASGRGATCSESRIDGEHANAYRAWLALGAPGRPTKAEIAGLQKDGALTSTPLDADAFRVEDGRWRATIRLPRHGVSLLSVDW